jgi:hypothetical protein
LSENKKEVIDDKGTPDEKDKKIDKVENGK